MIPHGSSIESIPRHVTKAAARRELGLEADGRVILFLGMIKKYKGLEYLAEAFESVRSRLPDARLLIVGRVDTDDPESADAYARLLGELEGRAGVHTVPGYVPFDRLATYLLASDVVALPYVKSYTSGVLLWAYAAGRPVVVTSTGGLAESVVAGQSGFVVPPRDTPALAEALVGVIQSPERSDAMGDYARNLAETRYSWPTVAERTLKLYRELLNRPEEEDSSAPAGETPATERPARREALSR